MSKRRLCPLYLGERFWVMIIRHGKIVPHALMRVILLLDFATYCGFFANWARYKQLKHDITERVLIDQLGGICPQTTSIDQCATVYAHDMISPVHDYHCATSITVVMALIALMFTSITLILLWAYIRLMYQRKHHITNQESPTPHPATNTDENTSTDPHLPTPGQQYPTQVDKQPDTDMATLRTTPADTVRVTLSQTLTEHDSDSACHTIAHGMCETQHSRAANHTDDHSIITTRQQGSSHDKREVCANTRGECSDKRESLAASDGSVCHTDFLHHGSAVDHSH